LVVLALEQLKVSEIRRRAEVRSGVFICSKSACDILPWPGSIVQRGIAGVSTNPSAEY
jgi:hypothetical protein